MKSLYESGKNAEKTCNSLKTRIFFYEFSSKDRKKRAFSKQDRTSFQSIDRFLVWNSLCFGCKKENAG